MEEIKMMKECMDALIEAMQDPETYRESYESVKQKDYVRIRDAIDSGTGDRTALLSDIGDMVHVAEEGAFTIGVCAGLQLLQANAKLN